MIASEVTAQAAVLLNDAAQILFTDIVLLPVLGKANEELEQLLEINEIPLQKQVSASIAIAQGVGEVPQPIDFVEALDLREREAGGVNWGGEITEVDFIDPNNTNCGSIIEWCGRNAKILINPPTSNREVLLNYIRKLTPITAGGSVVEIYQAKPWLAARTAQLAAQNIGNNPKKAEELQVDVDRMQDVLIRMLVKRNQGMGVRRKPYKGRNRP